MKHLMLSLQTLRGAVSPLNPSGCGTQQRRGGCCECSDQTKEPTIPYFQ
jgi:hypothetical protein